MRESISAFLMVYCLEVKASLFLCQIYDNASIVGSLGGTEGSKYYLWKYLFLKSSFNKIYVLCNYLKFHKYSVVNL